MARTRGYAHRVDIASEVQSVWSALTDTAALARWCSPQAEIRAKPGGSFRASIDRVVELDAHIDVFQPGKRLRLIYLPTKALPPADSALVDDFLMQPGAKGGTLVRLLGSGIPDAPEWDTPYLRLRTGWERAIARLKVFVEQQRKEAPP
ncbi:MAG TPA: SRPBCC domain-containing protein [Steroidobacteraceae bacterium]|nr:SRPBCC domain-containing protein [Steroidobacteraceae bacterium]